MWNDQHDQEERTRRIIREEIERARVQQLYKDDMHRRIQRTLDELHEQDRRKRVHY